MINRETLIVYRYDTNKIYTLGTFVDLYGREFVAKNFGTEKLFLFYDSIEKIHAGIRRGRHSSHFNKRQRVLPKYKKLSVYQSLLYDFSSVYCHMSDKTSKAYFLINKYATLRAKRIQRAATIIQSHMRRKVIQLYLPIAKRYITEGIDITTDPITCDPLIHPVMISNDWMSGSHILYNLSTIHKCAIVSKQPIYEIEQDDGSIQYVYKVDYTYDDNGHMLFKSPYTRNTFTVFDIVEVQNSTWLRLAQAMIK